MTLGGKPLWMGPWKIDRVRGHWIRLKWSPRLREPVATIIGIPPSKQRAEVAVWSAPKVVADLKASVPKVALSADAEQQEFRSPQR